MKSVLYSIVDPKQPHKHEKSIIKNHTPPKMLRRKLNYHLQKINVLILGFGTPLQIVTPSIEPSLTTFFYHSR